MPGARTETTSGGMEADGVVDVEAAALCARRAAAQQRLALLAARRTALDTFVAMAEHDLRYWTALEEMCVQRAAHSHCQGAALYGVGRAAGREDQWEGGSRSAERTCGSSSPPPKRSRRSQQQQPEKLEALAEARRHLHSLQAQTAEEERALQAAARSLPRHRERAARKQGELDELRKRLRVCPCMPSLILVLPETVLLKIFDYVERKELIASVRNVCSQWRRLSEDLSLWRSGTTYNFTAFDMFYKPNYPGVLRKLSEIRAAPRVDSLSLYLDDQFPKEFQESFLDFDLKQKVKALRLDLSEFLSNNRAWGQLLRKLGPGLTEFCVYQDNMRDRLRAGQVKEFYQFINKADNLKVLKVQTVTPIINCVRVDPLKPRALESIHFDGGSLQRNHEGKPHVLRETAAMRALIKASRGTLKVFRLTLMRVDEASDFPSVFRDLAACPLLEAVEVPLARGFGALARCPVLAELQLIHPYAQPADLELAEESLAALAGSSLRKLCVYGHSVRNPLLPAIKLHTQLTSLVLDGTTYDSDVVVVLRCLPGLEELRVSTFPGSAADLAAITTDKDLAPNLRLLHVRPDFNEGNPHDAVDELCAQRPQLRIGGHSHYEFRWNEMAIERSTCRCEVCGAASLQWRMRKTPPT